MAPASYDSIECDVRSNVLLPAHAPSRPPFISGLSHAAGVADPESVPNHPAFPCSPYPPLTTTTLPL